MGPELFYSTLKRHYFFQLSSQDLVAAPASSSLKSSLRNQLSVATAYLLSTVQWINYQHHPEKAVLFRMDHPVT